MGSKKEWFVDQITQHILELVDLTYRVSHQYVSDNPRLSLEYDVTHHTIVVCVDDDEWVISIKQRRRNKSSTVNTFDEVTRVIHERYPIVDIYELNRDIIEHLQQACLKHIDLSRESSILESFFKFQAWDGVLTSTIQDRERHIWRGVVTHRGTDIDYITVVDAHHSGYPHLSDELNQQYIEGYIFGQLNKLNALLDVNRRLARKEMPSSTDVSLLNCMKWYR